MWRSPLLSVKRSLGVTLCSPWKITPTPKRLDFLAPLSSVPSGNADTQELRVFIVAGEPSGDIIGSRLMASLRRLSPKPLQFAGVGGTLMEKEGLKSEFKMEDITVMGVAELFPHILRIWVSCPVDNLDAGTYCFNCDCRRKGDLIFDDEVIQMIRLRQTVAAALLFKPHVVVTVDAKGFSFRVLRSLVASYVEKGEERPFLVHYVAPSYWAWKWGDAKLKNLREFVDHLLCILPFEAAMCKAHGVGASFVGHPVLEDSALKVASGGIPKHGKWEVNGDGAGFRDRHSLHSGALVISVLPGSRVQEVRRMLPLFRGALHLLSENFPNLTAVIPTAPSPLVTDMIKKSIKSWEVPVIILPSASEIEKYDAFAASNAALCTSGTAVMQLQMARVPCVVAYRAHPVTEWLIKSRTKLQYISLPNILLNAPVVPEALFSVCRSERLRCLLKQILENHEARELQSQAAEQVLSMLAPPTHSLLQGSRASITEDMHMHTPSAAAATTILELLNQLEVSSEHQTVN